MRVRRREHKEVSLKKGKGKDLWSLDEGSPAGPEHRKPDKDLY